MNKLGKNTKTAKAPEGWENYILHLSPMNKAFQVLKAHKEQVERLILKRMKRDDGLTQFELDTIKAFNSCPWAGACGKYCLNTSGRGKFSNVQVARSAKTIHKVLDSDGFDLELVGEIERKAKKAKKEGKKIAIRLNGTSDMDWTKMVIQHFPDIQFYDYSKSRDQFNAFVNGQLPSNYHLTYSYDRKNDRIQTFLKMALSQGGKVAIMQGDYDKLSQELKDFFPSIDGDKHDLRFLDSEIHGGAFVILQEKGEAKK